MSEFVKLESGGEAPDFTLEDDQGRQVSLDDFRGLRVALFFYAQDGSSGCTAQALGFAKHFETFRAGDTVVLGIGPDPPASHAAFRKQHQLPFALLSDEDHAVARAYGCWGKRRIMGKEVEGVLRSHFIIDELGRAVDCQSPVGATDSVKLALTVVKHLAQL